MQNFPILVLKVSAFQMLCGSFRESILQRGYTPPKRSLESMRDIWERPLYKLATHKDLLRLCKDLVIQSETGEMLFVARDSPNEGTSLAREIMNAIVTTCDPNYLPTYNMYLEKYLQVDKDAPGALKQLYAKKIDEPISKTKAGRILKAINQEIVFPVVRELRDQFYDQFPFKDIRGTWKVGIVVNLDGSVTVTHYKREQSHMKTEGDFSFFWQLDLYFTPDALSFKPEYYISLVKLGDIGTELEIAMKPYYHRATSYRNIWVKVTKSTLRSIANSLPRIAESGSIWHYSSPQKLKILSNAEPILMVKSFMETLVSAVDPHLADDVNTSFQGIIDSMEDLYAPTPQIKKALKKQLVPFSSKTFCILKALSSDIVAPAIMQLRKHIYPFAKYQDVKGSWKYRISLLETQTIITIEKKECAVTEMKNTYFDFTWELIISFDSGMTVLVDAEFYITECCFHESTKSEFRLWIGKLFKPFTSMTQPPKIFLKKSFPTPSILLNIINSLRQTSLDGIPDIPIGDDISLPLLNVLESLQELTRRRGVLIPDAYLLSQEIEYPE